MTKPAPVPLSALSLVILSAAKDLIYHQACLHGLPSRPAFEESPPPMSSFGRKASLRMTNGCLPCHPEPVFSLSSRVHLLLSS
jgi:hypothetical protein